MGAALAEQELWLITTRPEVRLDGQPRTAVPTKNRPHLPAKNGHAYKYYAAPKRTETNFDTPGSCMVTP